MGWFKKSDEQKLDRYNELSQQLAGYGHDLHDVSPSEEKITEYTDLYHELKDKHDVPFVGPRWWKLLG